MQAKGQITDNKVEGLSVTRCLGRLQVKCGPHSPIISSPEVKVVKITQDLNFLLLLSGSILANQDPSEVVAQLAKTVQSKGTVHEKCGAAVDKILMQAATAWPIENLTCILIGF